MIITRAVIVQITTVSMNGSKSATKPSDAIDDALKLFDNVEKKGSL